MDTVLKWISSFLVIVHSLDFFFFCLFLVCANPTSCWEYQFENLAWGMKVSKYSPVPMNKHHSGSWHLTPQTSQWLLIFSKLSLCLLLFPVSPLTRISQGGVEEPACPLQICPAFPMGKSLSNELTPVLWLNLTMGYSPTGSCVWALDPQFVTLGRLWGV